MDNEIGKYEVVNLMSVVNKTERVTTNCMVTRFKNQGKTDVYIKPESSGGARLRLEPNEQTTYGTYDFRMQYISRFDVEFDGAGDKELLVEQEQVRLKASCK